jgi:hypothetical protein
MQYCVNNAVEIPRPDETICKQDGASRVMIKPQLSEPIEPTRQHLQILELMIDGDLIWEVPGKGYRSIYNETRKRDQRVPPTVVEEMERLGSLQRLENPSGQRLEGWGLTHIGRELAECQSRTRSRRRKVSSPIG